MWNTFSNLIYIILTIYFYTKNEALYRAHKGTSQMKLTRMLVGIFGSILIGVGSFLFHMTLFVDTFKLLTDFQITSISGSG
jgi:hypothetical protein